MYIKRVQTLEWMDAWMESYSNKFSIYFSGMIHLFKLKHFEEQSQTVLLKAVGSADDEGSLLCVAT